VRDWGERKKDQPVPIVPSGIGPEVGARLTEMDFYNRRVGKFYVGFPIGAGLR